MFFRSTSRITGTSRPFSVSTAMPMWTYFLRTTSSLAMSIDALNCGNTLSADATTFSAIAVIVSLPPAASTRLAYFCRSASRSVMSALSPCVTCGTVDHAVAMRSAVLRRTARIGWRSTSPHLLKSGRATARAEPGAAPLMMLRALCLHVVHRDPPARTGTRHLSHLETQLARVTAC